jgi:putative transposase
MAGEAGIREQSRRPQRSPRRTATEIEQRIAEVRRVRPDWGARKLLAPLKQQGVVVPAATVHRVLLRLGLVREQDRRCPALLRFEREQPNQLWQMDFKSPKGWDSSVGPLSVLEDASRYAVALEQTGSTRGELVRERLESTFHGCGLPDAMLMDHGCPWWNQQAFGGWTQLTVVDETGYTALFFGCTASSDAGQGRALPRGFGDGSETARSTRGSVSSTVAG